jgi:putative ABC transport system permease protein
MWRNYLASALGNLVRNRFYAAITISGLGIGLAAALIIGLYVRSELTYDRWIPGHENVYVLNQTLPAGGGMPVIRLDTVQMNLAAAAKAEWSEVEAVTRLIKASKAPQIRKDDVSYYEDGLVWAEPATFQVFPVKAIAGVLDGALARPDGLVVTRSIARKYFGRDDPVGELLSLDPQNAPNRPTGELSSVPSGPHFMRIAAVIEDLPVNSNLRADIFASSLAPFSRFAVIAEQGELLGENAFTFVRLAEGASVGGLRSNLDDFARRHIPPNPVVPASPALALTPITYLHLQPAAEISMGERGSPPVLIAISAIAAFIVVIACVNFVTLMTARGTRRALETGVRKALGASRTDLILQYLSEAVIYVLAAMVLAMIITELVLPYASAFLGRTIQVDYLREPLLLVQITLASLAVGVLAGAYPALVLSAFRPQVVLNGGASQSGGTGIVRQVLVMVQFALLIFLIISAAAIYHQTRFALERGLQQSGDQVYQIAGGCDPQLLERVRRVNGVEGAACAQDADLSNTIGAGRVVAPNGETQELPAYPVGFGYFEVYGLKAIAGRTFDESRGADRRLLEGGAGNPSLVINETAARRLGFQSPADAVGKAIAWKARETMEPSEIVGVVPDFSFSSVAKPVAPVIFYVDAQHVDLMSVRLSGDAMAQALQQIADVWRDAGQGQLRGRFLSQRIEEEYSDVVLQSKIIGIGMVLALCIACSGLFALSVFTTERRAKEIGIRKAMGARTSQVVRLLVWQFTLPVLAANLLAWPLAFWLVSHWLGGFVYRIGFPFWAFGAASIGAVLMAWVTVGGQAYFVARAKPVTALRYE